jgi:hypothetical protein
MRKIIILLLLVIFNFAGLICAKDITKEKAHLLIKVEPRTIVLPENPEIVKVPVSAARVRSTELRQLNEKYNAVEIERLFEVRQIDKPSKGKITEVESVLVAKEAQKKNKGMDLTNIFTAETRKKLKKEDLESNGAEITEKLDVYLIIFEFDPAIGIDINTAVTEYKALPVVKDAEYVIIK